MSIKIYPDYSSFLMTKLAANLATVKPVNTHRLSSGEKIRCINFKKSVESRTCLAKKRAYSVVSDFSVILIEYCYLVAKLETSQ